MKRLWNFAFGEKSMVRQAYGQFFLALVLFALIFLPSRVLLQLTFALSVWAIIITAQSFISAAGGNKKLVTILEHIEDIVEKLEKLQIDVEKVEAETANIDVVNADKVEADEIKET
jgi:hypothetical protein